MSPHSSNNSAYDLPVHRSPTDESANYNLSNSGNSTGNVSASAGDKRRTSEGSGALKDRRKSHGGTSHPHGFDSAEHSPEEEEGTPKTGTSKISAKRKEQNRNAQRAFRERKEKHMSTLENRIDTLEQKTSEQSAENDALKQLLAGLREENERLRLADPLASGNGLAPIVNPFAFGSTGLPDFDFTSANAFSSPSSSSSLPYPSYPPPSSSDLVDISAILPGFATSNNVNNFSFLDTSLPSPLGGNGDFNFTYSADVPAVTHSLSPLSSTSNADPAEESSSSSSAHSARSPSTPPSFISDYRDPALPPFKSVANDFNFGGDDRADLDDFSAFLVTSPLPVPNEPIPTPIYPAGSQEEGGYKFDLDGLCSDMATKATCQEAARQLLQAAMKEDALAVSAMCPLAPPP